MKKERTYILVLCLAAALVTPTLFAHCDSLDGPVVLAARKALETGEVAPVLRWVRPEDEASIRDAFARALKVRSGGPEAQDLADTYFFETVVRIHRMGEGAPFTGLKPAGMIEAPIAHADDALARGDIRPMVEHATEELAQAMTSRFARVQEAAKHADESVEAGREWVEAYVDYVHFIERMHGLLTAEGHAHEEAEH